MKTKVRDSLYYELRYKSYIGALEILKSNSISVVERKAAIHVRDEFEFELRSGEFEPCFNKGEFNK